jgi:hypothetical protein
MISQDLRSDKVLDLMRGYTRRQPWVLEDRRVLQGLFDTLDDAHGRIRMLEDRLRTQAAQAQHTEQALQRRIHYLEYRVKEEQNKGFWSYLRMLVSACR